MSIKSISTKNKALSINLDPSKYGVLAEIGGGQEVARAFFQAGGASGTVAKSISAYDKTFSDALYNAHKPGRYVSEDRLVKMLDNEYEELDRTLDEKRASETTWFVFADTVETLNYQKNNQGHGWLGMRFQLRPDGPVNTVVLHALFHENDMALQQYTLGALGVNLIYACFHHADKPNTFLRSLMDNLDRDRVEINMLNMHGSDLDYVDNRLLSVQLVKNGMTSVSMFDRNGRMMRPAELFYKKDVMILRGSFRPLTYTLVDMLRAGTGAFRDETGFEKGQSVTICEMTMNNLVSEGEFDEQDFLDRVDVLNDNGQHVMITDFKEFYKLSQYFSRHKIRELRIILGVKTLQRVMESKWYSDLPGGLFQAMGLLFPENTALYAYPMLDSASDRVVHAQDASFPEEVSGLYDYLLSSGRIKGIRHRNKSFLSLPPHEVMEKICEGNPEWETYVPRRVASLIQERGLFGYDGEMC
ncbi:MAG: TonB-dependent receptor [Bacteroidota bacterium]